MLIFVVPWLWLGFVTAAAVTLAQVRRKQPLRIGLAVLGMVALTWGYWVVMISMFGDADIVAQCREQSPRWFLP